MRTIEGLDALRELVTELRTQLAHERSRQSPTRAEPEPNPSGRGIARPLFDLTDDRTRKPE